MIMEEFNKKDLIKDPPLNKRGVCRKCIKGYKRVLKELRHQLNKEHKI